MHTDLPDNAFDLLSKLWVLKRVDYILADHALFHCREGRFEGVFTKLHALGLVEYDKVLMLDIDLAIMDCPDELFELQTPAAMRRGHFSHEHGARLDGRLFFCGEKDGWGQGGGINAGVMLLAPDAETYRRALREVAQPLHPEHIPGSGPEQDYLSRFFANTWHHISVKWNWQLHQMINAMEAALRNATGRYEGDDWQPGDATEELGEVLAGSELKSHSELSVYCSAMCWDVVGTIQRDETFCAAGPVEVASGCAMVPVRQPAGYVDGRLVTLVVAETDATPDPELADEDAWADWMPERIEANLDEVHIFHFSGVTKMWDRFIEQSGESDVTFSRRLLECNKEYWVRLFIQKKGLDKEYEEWGVKLVDGRWEPENVGKTIERSAEQLLEASLKATQRWHEDYGTLPKELGCTEEALLQKLKANMAERKEECHGVRVTCIRDTIVWASASEWREIGRLYEGQEATAAGPAESCEGYWTLPVLWDVDGGQGAVHYRDITVHKADRCSCICC